MPSPPEDLRVLLTRALDLDVDEVPAFLEEISRTHPQLADEVRSRLMVDDVTASGSADDVLRATVGSQAVRLVRRDRPGTGDRIGPYEITREIGEGGMGTVYLASGDGGMVCVKLLKRGMDTEVLLARFRQEAEILTELDHPYIAHVEGGASTDDGLPYFVMEYIEGREIDAYVADEHLSLRNRLRLFLKVCEAVQYAHQRLVVHRDLKPANILVTRDGTPKLLDFGIAKLLDPEDAPLTTRLTTEGRMLTPEYASPEQIRGERVTTATDVYSLGVLLYRLMTGHMPYDVPSAGPSAIERAVCETDPRRPSTYDRKLRGDLDAILETALRKEPDRRYGTVRDLAIDIRRHIAGEPITARRSTALYRANKFVRRNPVLTALTVTAVGFAIAMTVQTARVGRARDAIAFERDHATEMAGLLAEVLDVSDSDISFQESVDGTPIGLGSGSFSISAWILTDTPSPAVRTVLDKRVPPFLASRGVQLFVYDDRPGFQVTDGSPAGEVSNTFVGSTNVADGVWHQVVAVAERSASSPDRNRVVLYVDGEVDAVYGSPIPIGDVDCDAPIRVGHESDGFHVAYPFPGSIDRPRVFASALDSSRVAALYEYDRRHRRPFAAHVPSVLPATSGGDGTTTLPLLIVSRTETAENYVWSVGGRQSSSAGRDAWLTRFDPTSGAIVLGPDRPWAVVPIRVWAPEEPAHAPIPYQVLVGNGTSGERQLTVGTLHPASGEAPAEGAADSFDLPLISEGRPVALSFTVPGGGDVVCRIVPVDPIGNDAVLHFVNHRLGEAATLSGHRVETTLVAMPCDEPTLHEVVLSRRDDSGREQPFAARVVLAACGENSSRFETSWPERVPEPIAIEYAAKTRPNAFITDTAIRVSLTSPVTARVEISDLRGNVVRRMALGRLPRGQHSVGWDALDDGGGAVSPGLYAVNIYGDDYAVARWDESAREMKRARTSLIRTQVFRVRP